jgi:hypothetical protein
VTVTLAGVLVSCGSASTAVAAPQSDYTGLLIKASDIDAPESYTATTPIDNSGGHPGISVTFSNPDRAHGVPEPLALGTGGTTVSGPSPDGARGITVLMFTESKAFVQLEFDGPPNALVPPDFVTDVGRKQDAAINKGLAG